MNTVKINVKPQEDFEDRNADLVSRGSPATIYSTGSELNRIAELVETNLVVEFKLADTPLTSDQQAFLEHLRRVGIVKSFALYNGGTLVKEY